MNMPGPDNVPPDETRLIMLRSRRPPLRLRLGTVLALLAACAGGDAAEPGFTARDSAGVHIVEVPLTEGPARAFAVVGGLDVSIGGADDHAVALSNVTGVAAGADGRIFVADGQARTIYVFDAKGSVLDSIGREGEGPGEFRYLAGIELLPGDTLVTWDGWANRVQRFTGNGDFIDAVVFNDGMQDRAHRTADGTIFSVGRMPQVMKGSPTDFTVDRDTLALLHRLPTGQIDTVEIAPGRERVQRILRMSNGSLATTMLDRPFGRDFLWAGTADGLWFGHNDVFRIRHVDSMGRPDREIRGSPLSEPVSRTDATAWKAALEANAKTDRGRELIEKQFDPAVLPATRPAFTRLVAGESGELWVRAFEWDGTQAGRWLVFSKTGEYVGQVETPPGLRLEAVTRDRILGVARDQFDVPALHVYALARCASSC